MSGAGERALGLDPLQLAERLAQAPEWTAEDGTHELPAGWRRAAVAAVLRSVDGAPEVLLMRRAEREGDRWSGQISLPGGHNEDGDADLCATAVRETREEVGLDLDTGARFLGTLTAVRGMARGGPLDLRIEPHVFHLDAEVEFALGPEASEAFWFPLARAATGELDDRYRYRDGALVIPLPCWRFGERVVWGLTYRILSGLLDHLRAAAPP